MGFSVKDQKGTPVDVQRKRNKIFTKFKPTKLKLFKL